MAVQAGLAVLVAAAGMARLMLTITAAMVDGVAAGVTLARERQVTAASVEAAAVLTAVTVVLAVLAA